MKKLLSALLGLSTVLASYALVMPAVAAAPLWDTTGNYVVAMEYLGTDYAHEMTLTQNGAGTITGSGGSPAGAPTYLWSITSGTVSGNAITFSAQYTATADAVTPQTTLTGVGTIAPDGSMSGTWSDNYSGAARSGTWETTSGVATAIASSTGTLAAEDFGVVSYNTGDGPLAGYTAGFGLSGATLAGAQSVVVELFSSSTLLQRNTATAQFMAQVTGTQFSSPFDVSGNFNYGSDGFWTNTRESEYGQSIPATTVVATVMLANGLVVTATNTNPSGNPETIYENDDERPLVTVTIEKFINGKMATSGSANGADFRMISSWDADNIGSSSGSYLLTDTSPTPYQAATAAMTKGADYMTSEVIDGTVVGATCADGTPFALRGYSTGKTKMAAAAAMVSTTTPSFTNLKHNRYVIVWNTDCANPGGEIGGEVISGDGVLAVTAIDMIDTTATANGSFGDGWKYQFSITAPTSEPNLAMKFNDWLRTGGGGTIPVGSNMRISSPQANNGGATILLTAANSYSTPDLQMTSDLNPALTGRQVTILVEVAVPVGTPSGAYTTTYGVRSNP